MCDICEKSRLGAVWSRAGVSVWTAEFTSDGGATAEKGRESAEEAVLNESEA